jgi:hypothetical protein
MERYNKIALWDKKKHLTEPDPLILMIGHGADDP